MTTERPTTRPLRRAGLLLLMMAVVALGAGTAGATHTRCDDPDDTDLPVTVEGVGTVYVGIDTVGGGPGIAGWRGVCLSFTNANGTIYRSLFIGIYDPNPASPGNNVRIIECFDPDCTGSATLLETTGAETGTASDCNGGASGTGTCRTGTVVSANGTSVPFDGYTGLDDTQIHAVPDIKFGSQPSQIIACVGSTCLFSFAVTFGNLHAYANDEQGDPTVNQPLCIRVGANPPDCGWAAPL